MEVVSKRERKLFGKSLCTTTVHFNRADLSSSRSLENLMLDAAAELEILLKLAVPAAVDAVEAIHGRKAYFR